MRILTFLIVAFSLAGVMDSALALREHYNTGTSPCSINEVWDCGAVNHSPYAVVRSVPVATIGIVGYALLGIIAGRFPWITAIAAFAGTLFSLRLSWIEWKVLETWCVYCVISEAIILIIFALALTAALVSRQKRQSA